MAPVLLALSVLAVLAAVVFAVFVGLRALSEETRRLIKEFQTLIGGCVALTAALIAFAGVWVSVSAQSENTKRQLEAAQAQFSQEAEQRRDAERRAAVAERKQLAAALASEITVIAQVFSGAAMYQTNDKSIATIRESLAAHPATSAALRAGPLSLRFNKPRADYAVIYRANAGRIGLLSPPIAEEIVRFYGTYIQLDENLKTLDQAAKEHFEHMGPKDVEDALKGQNIDLKGLQIIKDDLVPPLQSLVADP